MYRIEVPDETSYWKRQIKCQDVCPVHTDARGYVRAIAEGNFERAYLIARGPNPLASICGRVCGALCEVQCRRTNVDSPVAIRALKRFVCERSGPESRPGDEKGLIDFFKRTCERHAPQECQDREELLPLLQSVSGGRIERVEGKSVGIIGGGPAGLAAAHDLALFGFEVTVYEVEPMLGGMLAVGIPEFRLPRSVIQSEVDVIRSLGVKMVTNCCVGRDISFSEIEGRHDVVIIAVGAKRSRRISIPGVDAEGVKGGIEFLREFALGHMPEVGERVIVVGGGDVAVDSARSALRTGSGGPGEQDQDEEYLAVDTARTVSRLGHREVHLVYRRSRAEMPARSMEIQESEEEGVQCHLLTAPVRIEKDDNGAVSGMWCQRMELGEPDSSGRRRPVPIENSEFLMECDTIFFAIGQTFDLDFLEPERNGIEIAPDGMPKVDENLATTRRGVYAAGDVAHGPSLIINAVASGKKVARSIYEAVSGKTLPVDAATIHTDIVDFSREAGFEGVERQDIPMADPNVRRLHKDVVVEEGYDEADALCEAGRCLDCGVNTIFDGDKCILCGGCAEVCPELCLKLVSIEEIESTPELASLLEVLERFGRQPASAIIKDEARCIRCGNCAYRCPMGAITMERFAFKEVVA